MERDRASAHRGPRIRPRRRACGRGQSRRLSSHGVGSPRAGVSLRRALRCRPRLRPDEREVREMRDFLLHIRGSWLCNIGCSVVSYYASSYMVAHRRTSSHIAAHCQAHDGYKCCNYKHGGDAGLLPKTKLPNELARFHEKTPFGSRLRNNLRSYNNALALTCLHAPAKAAAAPGHGFQPVVISGKVRTN